MKRRSLQTMFFLSFSLFSAIKASAFGVSNIEIQSDLGDPLKATVKILYREDLSADQIHVKHADISVYKQQGVEYNANYNSLRFIIERDAIIIKTTRPIKEPYMNFILEFTWPDGRFYKTFEVFLDPAQ
mgnify:CR=1 FL=1